MNWFDILLLLIFFFHLVSGFSRGLVKQLFDLVGFFIVIILSFWGSHHFGGILASYIKPEDLVPHHELIKSLGLEVSLERVPQLIAGVVSFLILFVLLGLLFRLLSGGFRWVNKIPVIGFINRISGGVLGALIGIAFVYIIIAGVKLIPLQFFMDALENSAVVIIANHYLAPIAVRLQAILLNYFFSLIG